jgi:hypothetical protein
LLLKPLSRIVSPLLLAAPCQVEVISLSVLAYEDYEDDRIDIDEPLDVEEAFDTYFEFLKQHPQTTKILKFYVEEKEMYVPSLRDDVVRPSLLRVSDPSVAGTSPKGGPSLRIEIPYSSYRFPDLDAPPLRTPPTSPHVENVPPPLRTPPSSPPHPSVGSPVFGSPALPVSIRRAQSHGDAIERPRFFDHSSLSSSESRSFVLSREPSLREATGTPPLRTPPPSPPFSDTSTGPESIGLSLSIDSLASGSPPPGNRIERLIDSQVGNTSH